MDEPPVPTSVELVEDLFRREYGHLVSALTRVLGTYNIQLVEDVVHDVAERDERLAFRPA